MGLGQGRTAGFSMMMVGLTLVGCESQSGNSESTAVQVAATSSYLACAVRDLAGQDLKVSILSGPGMCPGHFDLRPSQVRELRACRLLFRFDFQVGLDNRLAPLAEDGLRIAEVVPGGGLAVPETYLSVCRQIGQQLMTSGLLTHDRCEARMARISGRMAELSTWVTGEVRKAELVGQPVLTSGHQAAFCEFLGLKVAGTLSGADQAGIGELRDALKEARDQQVRLIIANRPEGRQLADALAEELGGTVVVFDNFPELSASSNAFDNLVRQNVRALTERSQR